MGSSTWYDFCVHIFPLPNPIIVIVCFSSYSSGVVLFAGSVVYVTTRDWAVLQERGHTGVSTMRDMPCPTSTASPGSANPVLHRFCHSTVFCRLMVHSLDVRKHVLKARGSAAFSYLITNHASPLGPTTRHVTRTMIMALWEQGPTQRGIAKTAGCGLATVARWVHKFKDAKDTGIPGNMALLDEPLSGAPNEAQQHHEFVL